jgi:hypothetical protein
MSATHVTCGACGKRVRVNADGTVRIHLTDKRDHLGIRLVCQAGSGLRVRE